MSISNLSPSHRGAAGRRPSSRLLAVAAAGLACFAAAAQAGHGPSAGVSHGVAVPVLDVQPLHDKVRVTRTHCDVVVDHVSVPSRRPDPAAPLVGAIFGGLLGSQLGHPGSRTEAAAVGVIVGAVAGDAMARADARGGEVSTRSRHCRDVAHWEHRPSGYRVTYAWAGLTHVLVTPHHPGRTLWLDVTVLPRVKPGHGWRDGHDGHGWRGVPGRKHDGGPGRHEGWRERGHDGPRHGGPRGGPDGWRERGRPGWAPG